MRVIQVFWSVRMRSPLILGYKFGFCSFWTRSMTADVPVIISLSVFVGNLHVVLLKSISNPNGERCHLSQEKNVMVFEMVEYLTLKCTSVHDLFDGHFVVNHCCESNFIHVYNSWDHCVISQISASVHNFYSLCSSIVWAEQLSGGSAEFTGSSQQRFYHSAGGLQQCTCITKGLGKSVFCFTLSFLWLFTICSPVDWIFSVTATMCQHTLWSCWESGAPSSKDSPKL